MKKKKNIFDSFKPNQKKKYPKKGPSAALFLALTVMIGLGYLYWYNIENRHIEQVNYTKLLNLIETNKIESVSIQDQYIKGKLKNGKQFECYVIPSDQLWNKLQDKKIIMNVSPPERQGWGA